MTALQFRAFRAVGLLALLGATWTLVTGRGSISAGVLLAILGLGCTAVAVGGPRHGPAVEGYLDLSARLGLGVLGGLAGAALALAVRWLLVAIGLTGALGVDLAGWLPFAEALAHLGAGAVWGLLLGLLYPQIPAPTPVGRGLMFSLLPSTFVLLWSFPHEQGLGWFGVETGALTFAFVFALNAVWGTLAGGVVGWGLMTTEAPVSRPIAR